MSAENDMDKIGQALQFARKFRGNSAILLCRAARCRKVTSLCNQ